MLRDESIRGRPGGLQTPCLPDPAVRRVEKNRPSRRSCGAASHSHKDIVASRFSAADVAPSWDMKYRLRDGNGQPIYQTVEDSWRRIARDLASVEADPVPWQGRFHDALGDFRCLPAGRILVGAGTGRADTLCDCFVMGTIPDSMKGARPVACRAAARSPSKRTDHAQRDARRERGSAGPSREVCPRPGIRSSMRAALANICQVQEPLISGHCRDSVSARRPDQ